MLITLVRDSNGEPLNALSVRNIEIHGGRVTLQFQKPGMLRYGPIRYWNSLYSSDVFAALRIALGSDVNGQSAAHQKVAGLPKPLAHLIEHLSGTPGLVIAEFGRLVQTSGFAAADAFVRRFQAPACRN